MGYKGIRNSTKEKWAKKERQEKNVSSGYRFWRGEEKEKAEGEYE